MYLTHTTEGFQKTNKHCWSSHIDQHFCEANNLKGVKTKTQNKRKTSNIYWDQSFSSVQPIIFLLTATNLQKLQQKTEPHTPARVV